MARHALESRAIGGADASGGLQVESADLCAQATERECVHGSGRDANANNVPAAPRPSRYHTAEAPASAHQSWPLSSKRRCAVAGSRPDSLRSTRRQTAAATRAMSPSRGAGVGWKTGGDPAGKP